MKNYNDCGCGHSRFESYNFGYDEEEYGEENYGRKDCGCAKVYNDDSNKCGCEKKDRDYEGEYGIYRMKEDDCDCDYKKPDHGYGKNKYDCGCGKKKDKYCDCDKFDECTCGYIKICIPPFPFRCHK